ncbi:MAG: hypothetical protein JO262_06090 [Solirubrobacterales bacterium]|nr:hypothetical protein [Solirubrobacterales bacterium]
MRRTITALSLLAAAAVCVLAIAGSAGAAPRIVCPVSNAHIVPCCPLPPQPAEGSSSGAQPICCPAACCATASTPCCAPTACCPSGGCCPTPCITGSLTIASAPNPSTAGRKVVISGAFAGNPASGAQVVLWGKLAGHAGFQKVTQTTTDSSGRYTFTMPRGTVMTDQAWYVVSNGVHSATLQQHVDALVGLSCTTPAVTVGQAVRLRGHVTPSHAGATVLIEQRQGGAWRMMAWAKLSRTSSYSISHRFAQRGSIRLRAELPGDARNDKSVSSAFTLTVKP